ncbi:MAG TPA: glycoside hydrolase family 25 protein [Sphingomonadaceae bacterium]|nr:glycoside hydrolase family 25 protein [Sphingomonadaceae bacterium]
MGRKKAISNRWRAAGALLLLVLALLGYLWWSFAHWTPERGKWPQQGILVGAGDVPAQSEAVDFVAFEAIGARFAYLEASRGADGRDLAYSRNLAAIRETGLKYGALHAFDPCVPADMQAANFVTVVPRDPAFLPPAVELDLAGDGCEGMVNDAQVESELTTFLNQIEGHAGKPALLKISDRFEERYHLAARIERDLWLSREYFQPDYAGRPWTLWTANSGLHSAASAIPVRWVVVQE